MAIGYDAERRSRNGTAAEGPPASLSGSTEPHLLDRQHLGHTTERRPSAEATSTGTDS